MKIKNKKITFNPIAIILIVLLAVYMLTMIVLLGWTLMTTVKIPNEYSGILTGKRNILWFPKEGWAFDNYLTAYEFFYIEIQNKAGEYVEFNILKQFGNSLLYSVGCSITMTLSSLVMGYAAARFKYKFSEIIYAFVLVTMALPIVGSMPSEIAVATNLRIFGTFPGIWILRASFLNTYFLIFYAQFKMIPKDYTEAAKIDGANPWAVMTQIITPLASGTTSTVFVLAFIGYWNDFQIPMVYLPYNPVAAYGMYEFQNTALPKIANTPTRLAGIFLMAAPIVVFYAIFNKKLNVNLSVGGIKG